MAKKIDVTRQSVILLPIDPMECPFREFRDNELSSDCWGMGPGAFRGSQPMSKAPKSIADIVWVDDQIQPLPRSVRKYLHSWVRAEELALSRWGAEVVVFEETGGGKMSIMDVQLSHAQVLLRSSFCRRVLSLCYILEQVDSLVVEHQWENFIFNIGPEGWRSRYHIYSPGLKPGGGPQHRPTLSKNGCYLVRLFYLGAWRCVWVSDQVPVDATGSPLLPFSPLLNHTPSKPGVKQTPAVISNVVHLWPLLLCKALLKLAASDMNDEDSNYEDELVSEFDILHALTGGLNLIYDTKDPEELWELITSKVPVFSWDDDDDTSTVKSRSTKKPSTKETTLVRRGSITSILIEDTKRLQPYTLPGITPGYEMDLIVMMARDLPLKKPLPAPDIPQWKTFRWVDWARHHGLYEAYDCPRTRFLKVNGLLKLSYAPHLLDVQSTETITFQFREEHYKSNTAQTKKTPKTTTTKQSTTGNSTTGQQTREELREWIQYDMIQKLIKHTAILYYPSLYQFTSVASTPPIRITKAPPNKALDIAASKSGPLYLQIDGPDENILRISLSILSTRVLFNCGEPIIEQIEPAYLLLEVFEWFIDCDIPKAEAFIQTGGYDSVEVKLSPGRHFCRLWVHSRTDWYAMLLSESTLLLGTRDLIQCASVKECPWASKFLSNLGTAFSNLIKANRSTTNVTRNDLEFYKSYQPDLEWNSDIVGYNKTLLHWMFRQALQSLLIKRFLPTEFRTVCVVLRKYLCDPDFGFPSKPLPAKSLRDITLADPCDCVMSEDGVSEYCEEFLEEQQITEENQLINQSVLSQFLTLPKTRIIPRVCDLTTAEQPCSFLKEEREKIVRKHEAATVIQAHWRGTWARKCLTNHVVITPEILKLIMENAFGNLEALSALMNEFFRMYPGAKYAYSVASALSGAYGVQQYSGICPITPKCKWIPYFQGVFNCHAPVKVHLDVQSSIQHSIVNVYNNDTGKQMPQAYNTHITFHFEPNKHGYTVVGHGSFKDPPGVNSEVHWQMTVLSSIANTFHVCDKDDVCKELPLVAANKVHIDEIFIPNRRNILGGIQLLVTKDEVVSFRAAATSPELEMVAILKNISKDGEVEVLKSCSGVGELYWPYIRLEPTILTPTIVEKNHSMSQVSLASTVREPYFSSARSVKNIKQKQSTGGKSKSTTKIKETKVVQVEPKQYCIEVMAPNGWPLTLAQWNRMDEIRNTQDYNKIEVPVKKPIREKSGSAKDKDKSILMSTYQPQPGDAYAELECSISGDGLTVKRDDDRDVEFKLARKNWDANEPGRNLRGAEIRKEFRAEFLETLPPPPESCQTMEEEISAEELMEGDKKEQPLPLHQGPSPATESGIEMSVESEEETKYLSMPEQLKDKFIPLHFVPLCTKDVDEKQRFILTPEIAETARMHRQDRIKLALERMRELQEYNELNVLGRQKERCRLLEKLFVDAQWNPKLNEVLEERDDAIACEALSRTMSATNKKQELKNSKVNKSVKSTLKK